MASGMAWLTLPFLVLAGGALDAGFGDFGHPLAWPTGPAAIPESDSPPVTLEWAGWEASLACAAHCAIALPPAQQPMRVWVVWDGTRTVGLAAAVEQAGAMAPGTPAFDAVRLEQAMGPAALHVWGAGSFRVESAPLEAPGLPNLVAIVPSDLGGAPTVGEPGRPGCTPTEAFEGARRCLRFSSGLVNAGGYRLELGAPGAHAVDAAVRMVQQLPEGPVDAGAAAYHQSHGHFHYDAFMTLSLHAFDPETGLRGQEVATRSKNGFCMVDWGLAADHGQDTPSKSFWRDECRPGSFDLRMGVSPGWYDLYRWTLPEQFLEMDGVPPGTYELVLAVDPAGTVVESDRLDNQASLRFSYQNGQAYALGGRGLYHF